MVQTFFLKEMLEKLDYVKYNSGTAQPKLNADVVAKLSVNVANSNEQFAISQLFKSFSQSIASNQRQQKKGPHRVSGRPYKFSVISNQTSQMLHDLVVILILQFLNDVKICLLGCRHISMTQSSRYRSDTHTSIQ